MSTSTTARKGKKFKSLVTLLGEEAAIRAWDAAHPAQPVASTLSDKDKADVLVAKAGLTYTRGRVYVSQALLEAQARVFKTGAPVVVQVQGERHTKGVLVTRVDAETVSLQNLAAIN